MANPVKLSEPETLIWPKARVLDSPRTMPDPFLESLHERAASSKRRIVLPESTESRTLSAAAQMRGQNRHEVIEETLRRHLPKSGSRVA